MGLNQEIWDGELVKKLKSFEDGSHLSGIKDYSDKVTQAKRGSNETINLTDVGASPNVLIDNTTYPIQSARREDGNISISLHKFETENTIVTDDELEYIAYDKINDTLDDHYDELEIRKYAKATHALAPQKNEDATPVIDTSGGDNGLGLNRMSKKDIVALKRAMDNAGVPTSNRVLTLSSDHYNDLLEEDQKFENHMYNPKTGQLKEYMTFKVYQYNNCPYFHTDTGEKLSFGALPTEDHYRASVAFHEKSMFKATGSSKVYKKNSSDDPDYRESKVGLRHHYIALPKKQEAIAAIKSSKIKPQNQS